MFDYFVVKDRSRSACQETSEVRIVSGTEKKAGNQGYKGRSGTGWVDSGQAGRKTTLESHVEDDLPLNQSKTRTQILANVGCRCD